MVGNNHKSFIFGDTLQEQLQYIPHEERLKFLDAIISFGIDGNDTNFEGKDRAIWEGMKALLIALNKKHWSSQLNGRNGGRPPTNNLPKPNNNLPEPNGYSSSSSDIGIGIVNSSSQTTDDSYINLNSSSTQGDDIVSSNEITTTFLINECEKLGFNITENIASIVLENVIEQEHLSGEKSFPKYVADLVNIKYPKNEHNSLERLKIYRKLIKPESGMFDEYKKWLENGCQYENKREEQAHNSYIPDAEETNRMLDEINKNREESTTGNLTDELQKIMRNRAGIGEIKN